MSKSILVVDDDEMELELLHQIFMMDYNVIYARNGKEAILQLNKNYKDIVIVLLDLMMPVLNGYQVLQVLKSSEGFRDIPIAIITSSNEQSLEVACYSMGVMSVIHKPFVAQIVRKQVQNIIEIYQSSQTLKLSLNMQLAKLNNFYDHLTDAISNLVEFRDFNSGMHIKRVKGMTRILAETYMELYPEAGLTNEAIDIIVRSSALHDIGKIAIPDSILLKPGSLTDDERRLMMSHTTKGCEILKLLVDVQDEEHLKVSHDICRYHHERYDGKGYPDGLKGDDIPLSAQLVSIVDVYDALVSRRVYKQPYSRRESYNMIMNGECGVFSPKLIKCFQTAKSKLEDFSVNCK